ncbi:SusC/RagA family TonB-linked outer membrane protein [Sphingobacterium olei]|uniref:SusC/RagA family TonB-linked outer membrane protein n=1 Tax=Sphingobacterium olei TaxID=2571155 RepID=A0A4U0P1W8_9SPHI|nr:SusC/RagA family TonB-linked outer membrane protein [Sphingobacterium olei]TJZ61286.1 SusC/RagA family TonB-linked outer membrane protein [Sphingobacterium olei]
MYTKYIRKPGMPEGICRKTLLIMRLTSMIFLAFLMQVPVVGFAQKITLSEKNASLVRIFSKIKSQIGYDFVADGSVLKAAKPVNLQVKNMELQEVLEVIFKNQPLAFEIQNNMVVVRKKENTLTQHVTITIHNVDIRGLVMNERGEPMAGASVSVRGSNQVTKTASDGSFGLRNLTGKETLITTFIGYKSDTLTLNGQNSVVIAMKPLVAALEDVSIVSTGYQDLNRDRATGSFGIITAKEIAQFPTVSILERLQGLVPGVNISTKTTAGKSRNGTINIRGVSTIVGNYTQVSVEPLLVVDGFPSQISIENGALDLLNADDIQQVTFLKDAAAASIWGIQAANGVIVITTKRGKQNAAPSLNFSTTYSTGAKPRTDYGPMMSVADYIDLEKDMINKNYVEDLTQSAYISGNLTQAQAVIFKNKRGEISEAQMNAELAALAQYDNADQISEYLLQRQATKQYNLSLSGGGVNSSYYMSGSYNTDDRIYKGNKNKGYSFNLSTTSNLLKGRVAINTSLIYGNTTDKTNPAAALGMSMSPFGLRPYDLLVNSDGSTMYYDVFTIPSRARSLESQGYLPFRYSALDELNYNNTINTGNNLGLNVDVRTKITSWLNFSVSGNLGRNFTERENYQEPDSYEARIMINRATTINSAGQLVYGLPIGGKLITNNGSTKSYNLRGQLNINKNWNNKHELNAVLGNEIREVFNKTSGENRYGYNKEINSFTPVNPNGSYLDITGNRPAIGATSSPVVERTTRALSYYSTASYTYDSKYTVSASARFDDLNLLGVERRKRAIPLWSGGLSWNMKKESFLKDVEWLSALSGRFTYGFTGNAPQGYAPVTVIELQGTDGYSLLPNARIEKPAREDLAWEKTKMLNYGLDFSLFDSRISGTFEYYKKHTKDIFYELPINGTYGFSRTLFNAATLDGEGVDLGFSFALVRSKQVTWNNTINLSYNTNTIHDERFKLPIANMLAPGEEALYDGYPTDYLFTYKFAGLDEKGETLIEDPNEQGKLYTTWDFPFYDVKSYSGRTTSPWYGAYNTNVTYKRFDLGLQFQYQLGGVFLRPSVAETGFYLSRAGDLAQRWRKPGDELTTNVPGITSDYSQGFNYGTSVERYSNSDLLVRSRSNVKLNQVRLSYAVPQPVVAKMGIKALSLSVVCRNLGMIWAKNKEKIDPDYLFNVSNTYQLAPVRNYSFQLNLSL